MEHRTNPSVLIGQVVKIPWDVRIYTVNEHNEPERFDPDKHNFYPDDRNSRLLVSSAVSSVHRHGVIHLHGYHLLFKQVVVVQGLLWANIEPIS